MSPESGTITRDDLQSKLEQIRSEVDRGAQAAKPVGLAVAGVAAAALLVGVYLLGRRRGRKNRTVVEVRRV